MTRQEYTANIVDLTDPAYLEIAAEIEDNSDETEGFRAQPDTYLINLMWSAE